MEFVSNNQITANNATSDDDNTTKELKEQDLISRLEGFQGDSPDVSEVDCTLKLGLPCSQSKPVPRTYPNPRPVVTPTMNNMYYHPSQVMHKYGVVNGRGNTCSTRFPWLPSMMNVDSNIGGFGFYGGPSMAVPSINTSILRNNYERYMGLFNQQNNVPISKIFKRRAETKPCNDSFRKCYVCQTTTTPLWRNGPNGTKSLCNACGIRYKKEERRVLMSNSHKEP